jgi:hypothetical protein
MLHEILQHRIKTRRVIHKQRIPGIVEQLDSRGRHREHNRIGSHALGEATLGTKIRAGLPSFIAAKATAAP